MCLFGDQILVGVAGPLIVEIPGSSFGEYEVVNPAGSGVWVVAFHVDNSSGTIPSVDAGLITIDIETVTGWIPAMPGLYSGGEVDTSFWDEPMVGNVGDFMQDETFPPFPDRLTWFDFSGGLSEPPLGNRYFLSYQLAMQPIAFNGFKGSDDKLLFDELDFDIPSLAVEPGETLGGFFFHPEISASDYLILAATSDPASGPLDPSDITSFSGTATVVPEPGAFCLLLSCLLIGAHATRRYRCRRFS